MQKHNLYVGYPHLTRNGRRIIHRIHRKEAAAAAVGEKEEAVQQEHTTSRTFIQGGSKKERPSSRSPKLSTMFPKMR
eukprot:12403936-Karenia_brevis.AAC.3